MQRRLLFAFAGGSTMASVFAVIALLPCNLNMKRPFAHFLLAAGAMLLSVASYGQATNSVPLHDHQARRPHRYLPAPII
jgi:hypothetical protein